MDYLQIFQLALGLLAVIFILQVQAYRTKRIIGGSLSDQNKSLHQVLIIRKYQNSNNSEISGSTCCGSILDDYHVISAAHCFIESDAPPYLWDEGSYIVIAGVTDLSAYNHTNWVRAMVQKIYVLKTFNDSLNNERVTTVGDIAVLKLDRSLNLTTNNYLQAVLLPTLGDNFSTGISAIVSGYGASNKSRNSKNGTTGNEDWTFTYDSKLRVANTTVISNTECNKKWDFFMNPSRFAKVIRYVASLLGLKRRTITEKHICAEISQRNPLSPAGVCKGDSGGPLIYSNNILIGIVSSGIESCDERKAPEIYTRVSAFINFIEKVRNYKDKDIEDSEILVTKPPIELDRLTGVHTSKK